MTRGERAVGRARALLGSRFRLHGREGATGLDCVGLVALAWRIPLAQVPCGYALRGGDSADVAAAFGRIAVASNGEWRAGDALLMRPGPAQLHLGLWTGTGLIHADAMLRRVVERPGAPPFAVIGAWQLTEDR